MNAEFQLKKYLPLQIKSLCMVIKAVNQCKHIGYVLSRNSVCHKMAHNKWLNAMSNKWNTLAIHEPNHIEHPLPHIFSNAFLCDPNKVRQDGI